MLKYFLTFSFIALYLTFMTSFHHSDSMKCDCEHKKTNDLTIYERRFCMNKCYEPDFGDTLINLTD